MKLTKLFSKLISTQGDALFDEIIGYGHIKRLFKMALDSESAVHILLEGPPASAKTMFLTSLMHRLKNSYFADGGSSSKAGMIDYLLTNKPRYLLVDEIDKMTQKDQVFLLNLMETGIVSETKYGKTRSAQMKTSVFATSNNIKKLSSPLQSRFFIVELEPYTYEQFLEITNKLLTRQMIEEGVASVIANAVWNKSRDIRDCVRIGKLAGSVEDVGFIVSTFLGTNRMIDE
ncbi:MAG TPA: AAA family ATPase [Nitrososphaeraceae archaeon]|nr:AAA family ATPase [Nitrososphaeraceae archaeon]